MKRRVRVCDAAAQVLRELDAPAVMWGDCRLIDDIAERAGMKCKPGQWMGGIPGRHMRVLNALSRQPGELVSGTTTIGNGRRVRCFWLPEHVPASITKLLEEGERLRTELTKETATLRDVDDADLVRRLS